MRRRFLAATLGLLLAAAPHAHAAGDEPAKQLPPPPAGKQWKLAWHDEFDGPTLDAAKWDVPTGPRRDGWWSEKAIALDGRGHLTISALRDGENFLSGCVRTRGKYERAFGYFVARVKFQSQPGHWSAFWLYNDSVENVGNGGRDGTEIDIMEKPWLDDRVQQTLHWDGYGKDHESAENVANAPGVMKGFHTFALWWKPDEYVYFIDGRETWRTTAGGVCQVPLYLKLSNEIGPWAGDIHKAALPDAFVIDYVRVYDLVDAAAKGSN